MSTDFTIDFESMGLFQDSVLLSLGATIFDSYGGINDEIFDNAVERGLHVKFGVKPQLKSGRKMEADTVEWWKTQTSASAKKILTPSPLHDKSLKEGVEQLHTYLKENGFNKDSNMWGRGYVEPMWYFSICKEFGIDPLINYWQFRDARTYIMLEMHPEKFVRTVKPKNFVHHDALHDSAFLILQMIDPMGQK